MFRLLSMRLKRIRASRHIPIAAAVVRSRYRPVLEQFEDRLAPAVTTFAGGILTVDVDNAEELKG